MLNRFILSLIFASACYGNTCTAFTASAYGPFPAVPANGIDGVSWSVARVLWTSDASVGTPATNQQIQYATAAEWAANPGVYPHLTSQTAQGVNNSTTIQSGLLSNLLSNTLYHVLAQSKQGGTWCTATDQTFTTLSRPAGAIVKPNLPATVNTTRPAMSGTHWVLGSNCGTTSGSTTTIDTANLQDCLNKMVPSNGDDLGIPPRSPAYHIGSVLIPNSDLAVDVTVSGSTFTVVGTAPANGTQVILGGHQYSLPPSPINPGIPYYVVNSTGASHTFQVSFTSGGTAITLLNTGSGTVSYLPYPLTQPSMSIHSTAGSNLLPPIGVRLGPDALAQYYPNMPELMCMGPVSGATSASYLFLSPLTVNLFWENIKFSVDPTVAQTNSVDPIPFKSSFLVGLSNRGIVYDQIAFDPGPEPTRVVGIGFNGISNAIVNSYLSIGYWQPFLSVPSLAWMTVTSNTATIPASTWSYVGSSGGIVSCPTTGGTITFSGTASGSAAIWVDANCTWELQIPTAETATSTVPGMLITHAVSPTYPLYTYTDPITSGTMNAYACIPYYILTLASGTITDTNTSIQDNFVDPGHSLNAGESGNGINFDGYGPVKFDNNYFIGDGIVGVFETEGLTLGSTVCDNTGNPCPLQVAVGNLTNTRNTVTTDTVHFDYDNASWDRGNHYWRNMGENKNGVRRLDDGNIIGPFYPQVGQGQCGLHESFTTSIITSFGSIGTLPPYNDSSDWTFTNNTCLQMPASSIGTSYSFIGYVVYPYPIKNFLVQNNLFLNDNSYAQVRQNMPFRSNGAVLSDPTQSTCGQGLFAASSVQENWVLDHNTVSGQGGCQSFWLRVVNDFTSGNITNNIFNMVWGNPGPLNSYFTTSGSTFFDDGSGWYTGSCSGLVAGALLACFNQFTYGGNLLLGTWSNSNPGSQVDLTTTQINTQCALFTGSFVNNCPNQSTLALRQASVGWFNVSASNFRLISSSPYISGNQQTATSPTTDGLSVGANMDQLEQHQGKVSNIRVYGKTSTSATLAFYAPDSFPCGVDWGTTAFYSGSGSWTRVAGATGSVDPRIQSVSLTGLPADALIYYRLNCAVMQPTGTIQLP